MILALIQFFRFIVIAGIVIAVVTGCLGIRL
jgi:hypothetical protein